LRIPANIRAACCSAVFTGTNGIVGWLAQLLDAPPVVLVGLAANLHMLRGGTLMP
jgi:hypothetical protein